MATTHSVHSRAALTSSHYDSKWRILNPSKSVESLSSLSCLHGARRLAHAAALELLPEPYWQTGGDLSMFLSNSPEFSTISRTVLDDATEEDESGKRRQKDFMIAVLFAKSYCIRRPYMFCNLEPYRETTQATEGNVILYV